LGTSNENFESTETETPGFRRSLLASVVHSVIDTLPSTGVSDERPNILGVRICDWQRSSAGGGGNYHSLKSFNSISKERSMDFSHLFKAGFGRRGFLSGSSLLLTSALLGASSEAKAGPAPPAAPAEPEPQEKLDKDALLADLVTANHILQDQGVVDGYGHVSARNPANPSHNRRPLLDPAGCGWP
jgi:hypothetical protein